MRVTDEMVERAAVVVEEGMESRYSRYSAHVIARAALRAAVDPLPTELEAAIHDIRARADKGVRDALVEQTRSIVQAADNLSGTLGHSIALLAQIDESRDAELPPLDGVVGSGREAVATWRQIKVAIEQTLAALDD